MPQAHSEIEPRSFSEIVDLVVKELGNPDARGQVVSIIGRSFDWFRSVDPFFSRSGRTQLAANAREIADAIASLESKLEAATAPLRDFLFTPLLARATAKEPHLLLEARAKYGETALELLRRMRLDCVKILVDEAKENGRQRLRPGPEFNRAQRHCATLAYDLMSSFSKKRITGSIEGSFHRIAFLLFEALSGRAEIDLKRHCDFVRKRRRLVGSAA
jgi:hypothetical protein